MSLLRDNSELLFAAIAQTSDISGVPRDHVEKDFWLTECLRGLTSYGSIHDIPILFKGGTSLSKAFGLIQRFSEDADMVVVFGEMSKAAADRHLKGFVAAAEQATELTAEVDPTTSDTGVTRDVFLTYPGGSATPLVLPRVKIELHTVGGVKPYERRDLRSILAEHWSQIEGAPPATDFAELEPFPADVVAPCRTLVEKLVLLHEAHTRDGGSASQRKVQTVRHFYDVWCLLQDESILDQLARENVQMLARDVVTYSQVAAYRTAPRPPAGFAVSPAFSTIPTRAVGDAYERTLATLVWPNSPSPTLADCQAAVVALAPQL